MSEYLKDYSGLAAAGSAFEGFAQAFEKAQDAKYKRLESEAQREALKTRMEREADESALKFYKEKVIKDSSKPGGFSDRPLSPSEQAEEKSKAFDQDIKLFAAGGKRDPVDPNKIVPDSSSPKTALIKDDPFSQNLRDKWLGDPVTKSTREISAAYQKMINASKDPSAAGDMSTVFGYMRMQDPNSTVREGEYATAQNAAGVPERIRTAYNKALSGEILSPKQRQDFLNQAANLYDAQMSQQRALDSSFSNVAQRRGLKGEDIVLSDMFPSIKRPGGLIKKGLVAPGGMVKGSPQDSEMAAKLRRIKELEAKAAGE